MKMNANKNILTIKLDNTTIELDSSEFDVIELIAELQKIVAWEEGKNFYDWSASEIRISNRLDMGLSDLQHFKDTSVGLWCTDKPEAIPEDKKHLFFKLK